MPCSNCGQDGHNARTCSQNITTNSDNNDRNHALWLRFDNITEKEADDILKSVIDAKREIASHGRGTFAKAPKKELPNKISEALKLESKKDNE